MLLTSLTTTKTLIPLPEPANQNKSYHKQFQTSPKLHISLVLPFPNYPNCSR